MKCLMLLPLLLAGCTMTEVSTSTWSLRRVSFLQRVDIPDVTIATNGMASMRGYRTDGGNEALARGLQVLSALAAAAK